MPKVLYYSLILTDKNATILSKMMNCLRAKGQKLVPLLFHRITTGGLIKFTTSLVTFKIVFN